MGPSISRPDRLLATLRTGWAAFLVAGIFLVLGNYLEIASDGSTIVRTFAFPAASLMGAVGVAVGVWRNRPARPLGFVLLLAGQACVAIGDLVYLHQELTFLPYHPEGTPSWHDDVANAVFVARFPLLAAALGVFIRRRTPGWQMPTLLDTCTLATGATLVWWIYVVSPQAGSTSIAVLAYPLMDVLIFAMTLRLMLGAGSRTPSFRLLMAGNGLLIIGSVLSGFSFALDLPVINLWNDAPYMLISILIGAAAMHPSMLRLEEPAQGTPPPVSAARLVGLGLATMLAPAVLFVQDMRNNQDHNSAIAAACGVLFALVVDRMSGLIGEQRRMATTDALTGVSTRRYGEERLSTAVRRATSAGSPISVIMVDADHFKSVNDTYGHPAGDAVLVELARRLQAACRGGDVVVRFGGEEFVLLLPGAGLEAAAAVAERIRASVCAEPIIVNGDVELPVTVSVGVASLPPAGGTADELVKASDEALYTAKRSGRNRVVTGADPGPLVGTGS